MQQQIQLDTQPQVQFDEQQTTADSALSLVNNLYQCVDAKDVTALAAFLSDDVRFRIGNFDMLQGKADVLAANAEFFSSITSMTHQIDSIWVQEKDVICHGQVNYVRLDQTTHAVPFATILQLQQGKISNYLVFVDLSQL